MGLVEIKIVSGIQLITFNRPHMKNALNTEMYNTIISRLNSSATDDSVLLTVLTGKGDFYSSGNDFSIPDVDDYQAYQEEAINLLQRFVAAFIDYPKLLIAVLNGSAVGIAATTLALCDIVYASNKASIWTPFSKLAVTPEACSSITFPRLMGTANASRLLYLNEVMTANEAANYGLVSQVIPDTELLKRVKELVQTLAKLPPQSLQASKRLVRGWDRELLHKVNQEECRVLKEQLASEEFLSSMITLQMNKSKL